MGRGRFFTRPGFTLGPARVNANVGKDGVNSVSVRAFGLTYNIPISARTRQRRDAGISSIDLPGPISYRPDRRPHRDQPANQPAPAAPRKTRADHLQAGDRLADGSTIVDVSRDADHVYVRDSYQRAVTLHPTQTVSLSA